MNTIFDSSVSTFVEMSETDFSIYQAFEVSSQYTQALKISYSEYLEIVKGLITESSA